MRYEKIMALLNDLTDLLYTGWKESNLSPPPWVANPAVMKTRRNQNVRDVAKKEAAKLMSRFIFREIAGGAEQSDVSQIPRGHEQTTSAASDAEVSGRRVTFSSEDAETVEYTRSSPPSAIRKKQNGMQQCEAAAAARVDPLIPSNPERSATWEELKRLFIDQISFWWDCSPFTPAVARGLETWVGKCRDAAQEVADETRDLKTDTDGLTKGQVSYWTEHTDDGPMRVFECVFKGRSIVKYRKRVYISAGHVEALHERFRRHGSAFAYSAEHSAATAGAATRVTTELFHLRLFSMLLRYETLFFLDQGTQGALPNRAFEHLQVGHTKHLSCSHAFNMCYRCCSVPSALLFPEELPTASLLLINIRWCLSWLCSTAEGFRDFSRMLC